MVSEPLCSDEENYYMVSEPFRKIRKIGRKYSGSSRFA